MYKTLSYVCITIDFAYSDSERSVYRKVPNTHTVAYCSDLVQDTDVDSLYELAMRKVTPEWVISRVLSYTPEYTFAVIFTCETRSWKGKFYTSKEYENKIHIFDHLVWTQWDGPAQRHWRAADLGRAMRDKSNETEIRVERSPIEHEKG